MIDRTADRHDQGKPPLVELLRFAPALADVARVMQYGRSKYPDVEPGIPNWTLGAPTEQYLSAALRHITAAYTEGPLDAESGQPHLAHVVWNLLAELTINYHQFYRKDEDGR